MPANASPLNITRHFHRWPSAYEHSEMSIAIPYPGGKGRLAKTIVSFLPREGRIYLEPFAGRANLFWEAAEQGLKFRRWWLNDLATAPFLQAIRTHGNTIEIPPRSRAEFEKQRRAYKTGDPTAALLAPYLSFSGGLYDSGCKGGSGDGNDGGGVSCAGYRQTLRDCHKILIRMRPRITALDWQNLGLEKLTEQDVVMLDAPYPTARVKSYSDDAVDYELLVDVLLRAKFKWLFCGYPHPLLHRLGTPIWARDMQLLCVRIKAGPEDRTECLWANYSPGTNKGRHSLSPSIKGQIRTIADAASLSFSALDAKIDHGLDIVAKDFSALVPYLLEMNRRLSAPGRRTDLRKGAPANLSWTHWVESKRHKLGRSLRTIQYLLKGQTGASRDRQILLAQRYARLRSEPDLTITNGPMEIAVEMARLVLEMRDGSQNAKLKKKRLELLAQRFLEIIGHGSELDSTGIVNRTTSVALTM